MSTEILATPFKLLHTSDWHLGRGFPGFGNRGDTRLAHARFQAVDRILGAAEAHGVNAVLCAGDVFHEATPSEEVWRKLVDQLRKRQWSNRVLVLLPGMHDPLVQGSPYSRGHPFRRALPSWVHVVDRERFELQLGDRATLHAVPCQAQASEQDPTELLPDREEGDQGLRIGLVHGRAEGLAGYETNFPVSREAADRLGFDYIALGDAHDRVVLNPDSPAPMVYSGTPELTSFGEQSAGTVSVVMFVRAGRKPQIQEERVSRWIWREEECLSLEDLRRLCRDPNLAKSVITLRLAFGASLVDYVEVESLLEMLEGTKTRPGKAGVIKLDSTGLTLTTSAGDFAADLPEVLQGVVQRLKVAEGATQGKVATRALLHLFRILRQGT
ncbi:MAG: DNA repair exonuclease [Planctomycetes bacterium]|nr:DNA repair exonuclease [Planctomycetota bacterium]